MAEDTNITKLDQKVLSLWKDPSFSGSYRGVKTFQIFLKTDNNIDISEKKLRQLLKTEPIYLLHKKPNRNFARRFYDVRYYGELVQIDLAYMFEYNNYQYFLLCVDVYSSKTFVRPLKSKSSKEVRTALQSILHEFGAPITKLESDRGSEFKSEVKKFLREENILFKFKFGKQKAAISEHYIYIVKKRLYMILRGTLSHDWPKYINKVVKDMNNTPLERLGWLTPNSITSILDSVRVTEAKEKRNIPIKKEPNVQNQIKNQVNYEQDKTKIQVDSYCYLDFDEKLFDKSFDVSVSLLFKLFLAKYILI